MSKFWKFRNLTQTTAELLLYGDIASEQSWFGDEATPKLFAEDLRGLGAVSEITVRINSGGGDVFAAQTIGNLLEDHPATVTAKIDGLCASAATVVACHCDKVVAANDSTYMVHPVKMGLYGYINATEMKQYMDAIAVIRENIISLYAKKTGREKGEVAGWMDATSWWTAPQAKENGFVDELVDGEPAKVENRAGVLFVNSINMGVAFSDAPKFVQSSLVAPTAANRFENKNPVKPGVQEEEAMEIKTVDDLRGAYPALVDQIEQAAAERATGEERQRIQDIEEMALPGSEELATEAKFTKPISAADYAKAAMKRAKELGNGYLAGRAKDAAKSGVNGVRSEPPAGGEGDDEFLAAIKSLGKAQTK